MDGVLNMPSSVNQSNEISTWVGVGDAVLSDD